MKNVSEILNTLLQLTGGPSGISQSVGSVPTNEGPYSGSNSFEDVLGRLAGQKGSANSNTLTFDANQTQGNAGQISTGSSTNGNFPLPAQGMPSHQGAGSGPLSLFPGITIQISEKIQGVHLRDIDKLQQSLLSLAVGLEKLLNLVSNLLAIEPSKAQDLLVAASGGKVTPAEANSLLTSLRSFLSQVPGSPKTQLLAPDTQKKMLAQMLQTMLQDQRVLFGANPNLALNSPDKRNVSSLITVPPASALGPARGDATLQLFFADVTTTGIQDPKGSQGSRLSINLRTFEIASFSESSTSNPESNQTLPPSLTQSHQNLILDSIDSQVKAIGDLFQNFSTQTSAITVDRPSDIHSTVNGSTQPGREAFKNLVQLLTQFKASQVVLSGFLQKQSDLSVSDLQQTFSQNERPDNLLNPFKIDVNLPPVQNTDFSKLSSAGSEGGGKGAVPQEGIGVFGEVNSTHAINGNPGNVPGASNHGLNLSDVSPTVQGGLNGQTINRLNELVARLNLLSTQTGEADSTNHFISLQQISTLSFPAQANIKAETVTLLDNLVARLNLLSTQTREGNSIDHSAGLPQTRASSSPPQANSVTQSIIFLNNLVDRLNLLSAQQREGNSNDHSVSLSQVPAPSTPLQTNSVTQTVTLLKDLASHLNLLSGQTGEGDSNHQSVSLPQASVSSSPLQANSAAQTGEVNSNHQSVSLPQASASSSPLQTNSVAQTATFLNNLAARLNLLSAQLGSGASNNVSAPHAPNIQPLIQSLRDLSSIIQETLLNPNQGSSQQTQVSTSFIPPIANSSSTPSVISADLNNQGSVPVIPTDGKTGSETAQSGNTNIQNTEAVSPPVSAQNLVASLTVNEPLKVASALLTGSSNPHVDNVANPAKISGSGQASVVQPVTAQAVTAVAGTNNSAANLKVASRDTKTNTGDLPVSQTGSQKVESSDIIQSGNPPSAIFSSQGALKTEANVVNGLNVIQQVSDQVATHLSQTPVVSRLNFQLIPESLGRVTVQVALIDQAVSARIFVTNPEVKEVLQHHLVELKTSLSQAGLQIDHLEVHVQGGSSNLLGQYFQYQQEGFGYRLPVDGAPLGLDEPKTVENPSISWLSTGRTSLVDLLI